MNALFTTARLCMFLMALPILQHCKSTVNLSQSASTPPSHAPFTTLLQRHVGSDGLVNYKKLIADSSQLVAYLNTLSQTPPAQNWTQNQKLAYYINTYNGYTLLLILRNYPVKSIKDISPSVSIPFVNTVWDAKFFKIGTQSYALNDIEHGTIRKQFEEPRVHFALNCASASCPILLNTAYEPDKLDTQLTQQAQVFLNDSTRNKINANAPQVSKIFLWYKPDFTKKTSVVGFINQYAPTKINENANLDYLDYSWELNEQK